jgi:hypothetical protein
MIQEIDLFVSLAEIAGVFVGFGALISFTQTARTGKVQSTAIKGVVMTGLLVIVAALLPVGLAGYGLTVRTLWLVSSLSFLLLIWASIVMASRDADHENSIGFNFRRNPVIMIIFWGLIEISIQLPLFLIAVGFFPLLAPAFYTTALILNLVQAAFIFTTLVFSKDEETK